LIQDDDSVNGPGLEVVETAAVLRATRDILSGESIRYQHIDHSEQVGTIPDCECYLHIGLSQPQEKETMLEITALVPIQSFPETWKPKIGTQVIVYTGGAAQRWRVNHIKTGIGTTITIEYEDSEMIVDKSCFTFDTNLGSLVLQRLGFLSNMAPKRTTNSTEIWCNILNPEKMMDGEALMVLLEWTIHGSSGNDKLGLPEAQSKTWLVDRSFWQSREQKNEPQHVPPGKCSNWVCVEEEPVWGTEVTHDRLRKLLDTCFSDQTKTTHPKGDAPLKQCVLPSQDKPNHALEGVQLMSCEYIKGTAGHYMPLESFSNFRRCERMIAKIKLAMPIHLLDHIIIPLMSGSRIGSRHT